MLSEEAAKALGHKGIFNHTLNAPSYTGVHQLWHKTQYLPQPYPPTKIHQLSFFKLGKTFGFETTRYIEYSNGVLYYYQSEKDSSYKGYCRLENVYMVYLKAKDCYLMHLTNGAEYSQFYFKDHTFLSAMPKEFFCNVIQTNFNEKYVLNQLIGKGSFSKVFLGRNRVTDQKVAVKIVNKKDKHGSSTKGIVEEEKRILTLMDSVYICKMEEFFQEEEAYIFVLEYLPGTDLFSLLKAKTFFTLGKLIKILKSVLKGLMHMHQRKVIHRDLKPQNIIVDEDRHEGKLIDFGLSLLVTPETCKKQYKRCGTMGYMAYQVIKNSNQNRKVYTEKCDMFSFGIIAHMMLLEKNPLKGKNYEETYAKNSQCNIGLDKKLIIGNYGESCYDFLKGVLQRDPSKRWSAEIAHNCKFFKQSTMDTETIVKTEVEEQYSPERIQSSDHYVEDDPAIQKPKTFLITPKRVQF